MNIQTPAQIVRKYGLKPNKLMGQNFINNMDVLEKIIDALSITIDDFVCEFGSGPGTLSALAFERGARVLGIEKDSRMINIAQKEFSKITFINADMRRWTPSDYEINLSNKQLNLKLLGNLPYYLTSFFIRRFLDWEYKTAVFMIQKEVGEKILAKPASSDYSFLTVVVNAKSTVEKIAYVNQDNFYPSPKVDSVVLKFEPKKIGWSSEAEKIAEICFTHRRQTIFKSLKRMMDAKHAKSMIEHAGIDLKCRPQELLPEDFVKLVVSRNDTCLQE